MRQAMVEGRSDLWPSIRTTRIGSAQQAAVAVRQLSISGDRVLLGLAIAVCSMGPLLWAFVRYWLFAP